MVTAYVGFFEVSEKQKTRNLFCICILDEAFYEPDTFTDIFHILLFRKPVRSLLMIFGRTFLMRLANDLAVILKSQLRELWVSSFSEDWQVYLS